LHWRRSPLFHCLLFGFFLYRICSIAVAVFAATSVVAAVAAFHAQGW